MKQHLNPTNTYNFQHHIKYKMLDNIEFFHNAEKFQNQTFLLYAERLGRISELIYDFFLLKQTKINLVIVCLKSEKDFLQELKTWNHFGTNFDFHQVGDKFHYSSLSLENIPVLILDEKNLSPSDLHAEILKIALELESKKIFFSHLEEEKTLKRDGNPVFEINLEDFDRDEKLSTKLNANSATIDFFQKVLVETEIDCVYLKQEQGALYNEIFSHLGHGTIFTRGVTKIIRQGRAEDILEILFMTKLYEIDGIILPIEKEELLQKISDTFVYLVNDNIVAFAMLINYGTRAELAKFCTQPRYQGKGKAKGLAQKLIEVAQSRNYESVFSLSIMPAMWEFFKNLGFIEVDRQMLPTPWKAKYDMSRPSKAFIKEL